MKDILLHFGRWLSDDVGLGAASKWATLAGALLAFVFFRELLLWTESPITLAIALGVENLVFVNAVSPLGLLSVLSAKNVIEIGAWPWLGLGYGAALASNLISYGLGRLLARHAEHKPPKRHSIPLTFWHPQLASLAAFAEGLRRVGLATYVARAVPWSLFWYTVACLIIRQLPDQIRSDGFAYVGLAGLAIWLALPYAKRASSRLFVELD